MQSQYANQSQLDIARKELCRKLWTSYGIMMILLPYLTKIEQITL